jgi:hypothetical protein
MVTEVNLVQSANAHSPMVVTLSGIVTVVKLQKANTALPMVVTLFGVVAEVN